MDLKAETSAGGRAMTSTPTERQRQILIVDDEDGVRAALVPSAARRRYIVREVSSVHKPEPAHEHHVRSGQSPTCTCRSKAASSCSFDPRSDPELPVILTPRAHDESAVGAYSHSHRLLHEAIDPPRLLAEITRVLKCASSRRSPPRPRNHAQGHRRARRLGLTFYSALDTLHVFHPVVVGPAARFRLLSAHAHKECARQSASLARSGAGPIAERSRPTCAACAQAAKDVPKECRCSSTCTRSTSPIRICFADLTAVGMASASCSRLPTRELETCADFEKRIASCERWLSRGDRRHRAGYSAQQLRVAPPRLRQDRHGVGARHRFRSGQAQAHDAARSALHRSEHRRDRRRRRNQSRARRAQRDRLRSAAGLLVCEAEHAVPFSRLGLKRRSVSERADLGRSEVRT